MQRDCPAYPQAGWGSAGYQVRSLDDPVRGNFGCLTTVDPKEKEKEKKAQAGEKFDIWHKGQKACSNTFNGFKFLGPPLMDGR